MTIAAQSQQGFSLVEVVVAVGILSAVGVMFVNQMHHQDRIRVEVLARDQAVTEMHSIENLFTTAMLHVALDIDKPTAATCNAGQCSVVRLFADGRRERITFRSACQVSPPELAAENFGVLMLAPSIPACRTGTRPLITVTRQIGVVIRTETFPHFVGQRSGGRAISALGGAMWFTFQNVGTQQVINTNVAFYYAKQPGLVEEIRKVFAAPIGTQSNIQVLRE